MSEELTILSAGAVKPGLVKVIDAFQHAAGAKVQVSFATAPAILERIGKDETVDVVIAPPGVIEKLAESGHCAPNDGIILGRIGAGVFVRSGEPLPRVATVEDFTQSLLGAQSVVYNQASTGTYLEKLFARLGIGAAIESKATRYPDFAAVLDHVSKGAGKEIGLGATTVIIENEKRGVRFAGPLPAEIQNYTTYVAAIIGKGDAKEVAKAFIRYVSSDAARSILAAVGIA